MMSPPSDPKGGPKPINAMAETVRSKPMFREAYRKRRCIVPVEGFFEWQATKGGKQPYAIAMKNGAPFGLAGLWENWKDPASGDWVRTFTIITVPSNELVARIYDRMPAILRPADYETSHRESYSQLEGHFNHGEKSGCDCDLASSVFRIVNYTVVSILDQVLERDDGAVHALLTKQIQVDIRNDGDTVESFARKKTTWRQFRSLPV